MTIYYVQPPGNIPRIDIVAPLPSLPRIERIACRHMKRLVGKCMEALIEETMAKTVFNEQGDIDWWMNPWIYTGIH
jgi:hypothetical protein